MSGEFEEPHYRQSVYALEERDECLSLFNGWADDLFHLGNNDASVRGFIRSALADGRTPTMCDVEGWVRHYYTALTPIEGQYCDGTACSEEERNCNECLGGMAVESHCFLSEWFIRKFAVRLCKEEGIAVE
uniref:hypothetical protein n=1 Tax=Olsenella timonensis TaxID=1805478 RepID=UPI00094E1958|nr:hypothetical protein [Olsenella timonensis]